jgi:hypothetical protein
MFNLNFDVRDDAQRLALSCEYKSLRVGILHLFVMKRGDAIGRATLLQAQKKRVAQEATLVLSVAH